MTSFLDTIRAGRRRWLAVAAGFGLALALSACAVVDSGRPPAGKASDAWVVLPIANYTETPQAGLRAESIAMSLLKARGFTNLKQYPASLNSDSLFDPAEREATARALEWARGEKARYALTGAVSEWRYKVGVDGEPAVGITLQVIDVPSGNVIWSATGSRTGWSRDAVSAVAQKLLRELLSPLGRS
ncbi:penicillin-binding protein activator LpoB [Ralstonia solanacearum]|nr:penicillin-binding protein activator LpoB [Ralstonia solanacearum]